LPAYSALAKLVCFMARSSQDAALIAIEDCPDKSAIPQIQANHYKRDAK
jgi:hypothetical protein